MTAQNPDPADLRPDPERSDSDRGAGPATPEPSDAPRARAGFREQLAAGYGASVRRTEAGHLDVMHAVGGVRGLLEALVPSLVFLVVFLVTENLWASAAAAVGLAVVAVLVRLAQGGRLIQSASGLVGVLVCAAAALLSGGAEDYYLPGLWLNAGYGLAFLVSILLRWPLIGLLFGFVRGEELHWRRDPVRLAAYQWATAIVLAMFLLRLAVQVPLFLSGHVAGLGIAHIVMGIPFYALALWLAWLISRPAERVEEGRL